MRGISAIAIAMITLVTDGREMAVSAMASRMGGIDINPSVTRMMIVSAQRTKPEITPTATPNTVASNATAKPTINDTRAPCITRANKSRPSMSVPNQCSADAVRPRSDGVIWPGSCCASQGASSATSAIRASRPPPTAIAGWRRTHVQAGP